MAILPEPAKRSNTMAKVGRPKLVQNMDTYELRIHKNAQAMQNLTEEQLEAVRCAQSALHDFVHDFTEMFDVSVDTARHLQSAFYRMGSAFREND